MTMIKRRASTLVELMMCLSAGSSLMLVAIGLVHQSMKIARESSQQADHDRSLARLASLFRDDAHRATRASAPSDVELSMSRGDDSQVIYRFANNRITRQQELASGDVEHESFALEHQHAATFQSSSDPNQVELLIRREAALTNVAPRTDLHIMAALGRWQWAEQGGEEASGLSKPSTVEQATDP